MGGNGWGGAKWGGGGRRGVVQVYIMMIWHKHLAHFLQTVELTNWCCIHREPYQIKTGYFNQNMSGRLIFPSD